MQDETCILLRLKSIYFLTLFLLLANAGFSQKQILTKKVTYVAQKVKPISIIKELEKQTGALFSFHSSLLANKKKTSVSFNDINLGECLDILKDKWGITYVVVGAKSIVLKQVIKKQRFTVSGFLFEMDTKEKIIDAFIYDKEQFHVVQTNSQGFYSIELPFKDTTVLIVSRVGFKSKEFTLWDNSNIRLDILLERITLKRVEIRQNNKQLSILTTGTTTISVKETENFPSLFGESDILKSLQLLPGVQSSNDGVSGILVRGGTPDQNLILLDGIPVYQASHLYGLYSIFNSDAIKKVSITKSNLSVQNSSRLSSLVDIRTKDGNKENFGAEGSIGLISSKLMLEGPIIKDKTSFLISGRRSYIDILGEPIVAHINQELNDFLATYYFYDINGKINHHLSANSRLTLSAYHGIDRTRIKNTHKIKQDDAKEKDIQDLTWENTLMSLKYSNVFHKKLYGNFSFVYSHYNISNSSVYNYTAGTRKDEISHNYATGIRDFGLIANFDWKPNASNKVNFGMNSTYHGFTPGVVTYYRNINDEEKVQETGSKLEKGLETRIYIDDRIKLSKKSYFQLGLSYSNFKVVNRDYSALQMQSSFRKRMGDNWIGHVALGNSTQFLHYLPNSTVGLPTDIWLPSTDKIRPEKGIQLAIGAEYRKAVYSFKTEVYYKKLNNILEYKEDANFLGTASDWESKIDVGEGENYGWEVKWAKDEGKTTGFIAYTISWANRKFPNISNGNWFPFRYDRRHDISFVFNHEFTERKSIGLTWVYTSGNPTTVPIGSYLPHPDSKPYDEVYVYGDRNNFTMQSYHRLDLVYNYKTKNAKWNGLWSFGLYNAYNKLNPFYIAPGINDKGERTYFQIGLFPILPNISYKIKI